MTRRPVWTDALLGSLPTEAGTVEVRSPQLRDAAPWSAARLANRQWLERAFPAWGDDWAAEQSPAAWVQRYRALRAGRGTACLRPSVVLLDGRLVGEVGIDAVDTRTNSGEASAWLVRDHGGPAVMTAATLLILRNAFGTAGAYDRVLSPVATSSRRGRSPGLTAAGFDLELTLRRPVGHGELVDHDMWVVHNTAEVRTRIEHDLHALAGGGLVSGPRRWSPPAAAQVRAAAPALATHLATTMVRSGRRLLARRAGPASSLAPVITGGGTLHRYVDVGTATATLVPDVSSAGDALTTAVAAQVADVSRWAPDVRQLEVRLGPAAESLAAGLPDLGLQLAGTFLATPDGSRRFAGEQVWSTAP